MNTSPTRRLRRGVFALTAATMLLVGCSSDSSESTTTDDVEVSADSISIELARSPIPAPGDTTTPVYGILVNDYTICWSQRRPAGPINIAVEELHEIFVKAKKLFPGKPVVLIGHLTITHKFMIASLTPNLVQDPQVVSNLSTRRWCLAAHHFFEPDSHRALQSRRRRPRWGAVFWERFCSYLP